MTIETKAASQDAAKKAADQENKNKALELALSQIEKQFGKGSIMKMDANTNLDIPAIPTGSLAVDVALGIGGIPRGRVNTSRSRGNPIARL